MLGSVLSFAGWSYLPDFATRHLLPVFHQFYQAVLHRVPPPPNTPLYRQHYRYVYAFTVISYLCYNFREAALSLRQTSTSADDNTLKSAFRQFARKNHPDRVGKQGEHVFMEVRDAFDALKNPVTRFAYDRFGPDALDWKQCTTLREYIRHGLMQSSGFHIVSVCVLLLWSAISKSSSVTFWRYLLFATVLVYELLFILGPSPAPPPDPSVSSLLLTNPAAPTYTSIFTFLWPRRVAYQHVKFLHSLFLFLSVALARVAPVLFPAPFDEFADPKRLQAEVDRLSLLAKLVDREAYSQIQTELHSVHGPETGTARTDASLTYVPPVEPAEEVMARLTTEMEHMVIESQLRDGGPLKAAVDAALDRRQRGDARKEAEHAQGGSGMPSPTPSPPPQFRSPAKTPSRRPPPQFVSAVRVKMEEPAGGPGYVRGRSQSW
ncbi:DnaJ-domain-containing protein [Amylocystis lapponica]|nr:DnaJ-domain-containing protein [Amylocystis lapponica]